MGDDAKRGQKEIERKAKEMSEQAEEKKEEVKGKLSLVVDLAKQSYNFGLYLTCLSLWNATFELPFGLARAGAAATRTIVDAGDTKGTIHIHTHQCVHGICSHYGWFCHCHMGAVRACPAIIEIWQVHTAGAAKATAAMVKLGLLNLVRDIVVALSQHNRSDVVSQVTLKLLRLCMASISCTSQRYQHFPHYQCISA